MTRLRMLPALAIRGCRLAVDPLPTGSNQSLRKGNNLDYARGLPLHRLWRDDRVPAR